jgi:hypothetical protein
MSEIIDEDASGNYPYKPLALDAFRVIEPETIDSEIRCSLVDYPDNGYPDYFALSYSWGNEPNLESIVCDDHIFKLTSHLKYALQMIFKNQACPRLWVDAICIDQSSKSEKESQVAKMHHIYQRAKGVFVWLGKSEEGSDNVMDTINTAVYKPDSGRPLHEIIVDPQLISSLDLDLSLFYLLAAFSRRAWFRRLWIAQEYFFAKEVIFLCGEKAAENAAFIKFLEELSLRSFGAHEPPGFQDEEALFRGFHALIKLNELKEKTAQGGGKISFFDFVMEGRDRFVKEPVDRIYGAFGMAEDVDKTYRTAIPIDYSQKSLEEYWKLYVQFGKIALVHEPSLRLLNHVDSQKRAKDLPSWCPDLNQRQARSLMNDLLLSRAGIPWEKHNVKQCSGHPYFDETGRSHVMTSAESDVVSIWGAKLGRIAALGPTCFWDDNTNTHDLKDVQTLARALLKWLRESEKFCKSPEDAHELSPRIVFNRILVGEGNSTRRKPASFSGGEEDDHEETHRDNSTGAQSVADDSPKREISNQSNQGRSEATDPKANKGTELKIYNLLVQTLSEALALDPGTDWEYQTPKLFHNFEVLFIWLMTLHADWNGRVLFKTDSDRFGYTSENVCEGDHICILYGGGTGYVLREKGESCEFIADAYVLGFVDGEAFELLDEGVIKETLFSIS